MIGPRPVAFDWARTPKHWVPGDPYATHLANVLHLLLPAGERWFVHVFQQALPLIRDEELRQQAKGFMGQEAVHARAHAAVVDHLREQGFDPAPFLAEIDWLFDRLLGDRARPTDVHDWLLERLAFIAAIEHFTALLGQWVLGAEGYDRAGADPVMLDLLRWHGAEEVEHRSVAFDVWAHLDGSYRRRARTMAIVFPTLVRLWARGTALLLAQDPDAREVRHGWSAYLRNVRRGLVPGPREILSSIPRYLRPGHHPSRDGSTDDALAYLARSPAALAATNH